MSAKIHLFLVTIYNNDKYQVKKLFHITYFMSTKNKLDISC